MQKPRILITDPDRLAESMLLGWHVTERGVSMLGDVPDALRAWGESESMSRLLKQIAFEVEFDGRGEALGTLAPGAPYSVVGWGECFLVALESGDSSLPDRLGELIEHESSESLEDEIRAYCVHDRIGARRLLRSAAWAISSECLFRESRDAIVGYANELSTSSETIDFLYQVGRLMHNVKEPERIIEQLCDGLSHSMDLAWAAIMLIDDGEERLHDRGPSVVVRGKTTLSEPHLAATAEELLRNVAIRGRTRVLAPGSWGPYSLGRELVARAVMVGGRVGALVMGGADRTPKHLSHHEAQLVEASSGLLGAFLEISRLWDSEHDHMMLTLEALVRAIDAKDPYTSGHSSRVAWLSREIALSAGFDTEFAERAWVAGMVHDIGKIGVAEAVLCKSGKLTDEEFDEIKRHPDIGFRILEKLPHLDDVRPAVLSHHERWDGRGYPHGLAGEDIPILARVVGLADTFDAMSSNRAYRPAMTRQIVVDEINNVSGTQLDPTLVEAFGRIDLLGYDQMLSRHSAQRVVKSKRPAA